MRHCRAHPAGNRDPAALPVPRKTCWSTAGPALPACPGTHHPRQPPGPLRAEPGRPALRAVQPPGPRESGVRRHGGRGAMLTRTPRPCFLPGLRCHVTAGPGGPGRCGAVRRRLSDLSARSPRWGGERLPGRPVTGAVPRGTAGSGCPRHGQAAAVPSPLLSSGAQTRIPPGQTPPGPGCSGTGRGGYHHHLVCLLPLQDTIKAV